MPSNKQFESSRERKNKKDKNNKNSIYSSKHIRQKEELLEKSKFWKSDLGRQDQGLRKQMGTKLTIRIFLFVSLYIQF